MLLYILTIAAILIALAALLRSRKPPVRDVWRDLTPTQYVARRVVMGFASSVVIDCGETARIMSVNRVGFRGTRLLIPSDISGAFTVLDVLVGKASQLLSDSEVPARAFQENASDVDTRFDIAPAETGMTIVVRNDSGCPQRFRAVIFGEVLEVQS